MSYLIELDNSSVIWIHAACRHLSLISMGVVIVYMQYMYMLLLFSDVYLCVSAIP